MPHGCSGNMICMKTNKIKKGNSKATCFSFLLYICEKKKSFYNFNPQTKSILAVYKYSRRLLTRALSPKLVSNNFSSWLSHDCLNHSQVLILSNLLLHKFILVSKCVSSFFKVSIFLWIQCAKLKMCKWICASENFIYF